MARMKVIVDIDGTISIVGNRLKYLAQENKDWDSFYEACDEDDPNDRVLSLVWMLSKTHEIVYCTGRRESVRQKTRIWLEHHAPEGELVMRPDGDFRHDTEVKPEQLSNKGIMLQEIFMVLEDRNSMVEKWRALGLLCLQVAPGDF